MGIHILKDEDDKRAIMYSSSTDWAFGPVFSDSEDGEHTASERAQAFCEWAGKRDPRGYDDVQLESFYMEWLAQEATQWKEKEKADAGEDS